MAPGELTMTDAEGQTTTYTYNTAGQRVSVQWPDHVAGTSPGDPQYGVTHTTYNAAGRALLKTDQLGDTQTLVYDLGGRLLERQYRSLANSPNGSTESVDAFTYDAAGRLLTATKGRYANTVSKTYDAGGRTQTESLAILGQTYTVQSGYDTAGRLASLTYPDGTVQARAYNSRGRLQAVSINGQSVAVLGYDDGGRETSRTFGNGLTTSRTYFVDNNVASLNTPGVETLSYTYDANKNPLSETRTGVMADYSWSTGTNGFDPQNRLTNWSRSNGDSQQWTLSPVNDWTQFTSNGQTETRTHGPTHELLTINNTPITHDSKGNTTADSTGKTFTFDADNLLATATVSAGSSTGTIGTHTYQYDALGRRVAKTVGSQTTVFVNRTQPLPHSPGAGQELAEYVGGTAAGSPLRKYVYGEYIDEQLAMMTSNSTHYYHANRLFNVLALSDANGQVTERYAFTPYGEVKFLNATGQPQTSSAAHNPFTFTGRRHDAETRLHYFRARYFSPTLGRFISHDPLMYPDGPNTYAGWFVPGGLDPDGKNPIVIGGVIIAEELAALIAAGFAMTLQQCMITPACRDALESLAEEMANTANAAAQMMRDILAWVSCPLTCKITLHPPHHSFPTIRLVAPGIKTCWQWHYQIDCHVTGVSGSNINVHFPVGPCCKFKNCAGGVTH